MAKVEVQSLSEGMPLAADVVNHHGQVLIPVGLKLSSKHIGLLKAWGVQHVDVDAEGAQVTMENPLEVLDSGALAEIEEEMRVIFRGQEKKEGVARKIYDLCMERMALKRLRREGRFA